MDEANFKMRLIVLNRPFLPKEWLIIPKRVFLRMIRKGWKLLPIVLKLQHYNNEKFIIHLNLAEQSLDNFGAQG